MPVKSKAAAKTKAAKAQDKAKVEQKKKVVEDKTFGLKNKSKSTKVQKYIQNQFNTVEQFAKQKNLATDPDAKKEKKKLEQERQKELDELFKVAIKQPKIPPGVDPKSILCEAFKQGCCTKSFKCKFSHDLNINKKSEKIDLYTDRRDIPKDIEGLDADEVKKLIEEKHNKENANKPQKAITCKYFLEAVEKKSYGWFWKCPNGDKCSFRHALPPGYELKSQMTDLLDEEMEKQPDISEKLELERKQVEAKTKITEEVFKKWHAEKTGLKMKEKEKEKAEKKKRGILTGKEIFLQSGFSVEDDISASASYQREKNIEEEIKEVEEKAKIDYENAIKKNDKNDITEPDSVALPGPSTNLNLKEIDESLFLDGDDEELEELEQEIMKSSIN